MPCVKSGARAGSLYRNLVAHALTLGASGDRAPVRQQPWSLLADFNIFWFFNSQVPGTTEFLKFRTAQRLQFSRTKQSTSIFLELVLLMFTKLPLSQPYFGSTYYLKLVL